MSGVVRAGDIYTVLKQDRSGWVGWGRGGRVMLCWDTVEKVSDLSSSPRIWGRKPCCHLGTELSKEREEVPTSLEKMLGVFEGNLVAQCSWTRSSTGREVEDKTGSSLVV